MQNRLITDQQLEKAFEGTNFGSKEYYKILREGLLKVACQYWNGHTLTQILIMLKLRHKNQNRLTDAGRKLLYQMYER
jgi:hypothetical protein